MKQLAIKPKEAGSIIKFGKLPIFTRALTHWSDMDNVVQLIVEGRYYAVEYRHKPLQENPQLKELLDDISKMGKVEVEIVPAETSASIPEDDEVARECKADVEEAREEAEPVTASAPAPVGKKYRSHYQIGYERFERLRQLGKSGELAKCRSREDICRLLKLENFGLGYNWVVKQIRKGYLDEEFNQNSGEYHYRLTGRVPRYSDSESKKVQEKTSQEQAKGQKLTTELEKLGFTNLPGTTAQTSPKTDPIQWLKPYDYIIYKLFLYGNGQANMGKAVNFDEVKELFERSPLAASKSPTYAGRMANVMLVHLLRQGVLEKAQDDVRNKDNIFSLTVAKGGQYARQVYTTVSSGRYGTSTEDEKALTA